MDDLISRQAAIDEIEERKFANRTVVSVVSELNRLEGYILRLPSVHPEIIWCKDCKQYRRWIDTDICFCDRNESNMMPDDFCSRAERKTDE